MSETQTEIGGKKQTGGFEKSVGYFSAKVLAFNPNKDELNVLLDTDKIVNDIDYTGEKDGVTTCKIDVWVEDVKSKKKFKLGFYIMDKEVSSEKTGKDEYINSVGSSSWAAEEEDLPNYFTNFTKKDSEESLGTKSVRRALAGEDKFYKFLRCWLALDYFDPDTKLVVSKGKLMSGDLSELNKLTSSDIASNVILMATVKAKEEDDGVKEYQNIYNNAFLPASYIKHLRVKSEKPPTMVTNFIKDITDSEFGCKDFYIMDDLRKYDPADNLAVGNAILSEDSNDY